MNRHVREPYWTINTDTTTGNACTRTRTHYSPKARRGKRIAARLGTSGLRHAPFPTEHATNCHQGTAQCPRVLVALAYPAARAIFAFWQAKKEAEREAAKKRIEEARPRPRPRPCLLSSPPPHEPIASESNVLGTGDALRMGATGPCGDTEHHVATQHNLLQQHASTYYNTYDRIVRSGTSDSKASCSPDRHRPLRQPRPWTALPSSASSPRKGTARQFQSPGVLG
jgi:hypothetical protein